MPSTRNAANRKIAEPLAANRRGRSQERSLERRTRMACAAIEILASHGVAGLTHRLVAANARVSLAATTYYFSTKYEIVAEASDLTLRGYTESFRRAAVRMRTDWADSLTFRRFLRRLFGIAACRDRSQTLAWAEIILVAHRRPD